MIEFEKRAMIEAEDKYTFRQSSQISGQTGFYSHSVALIHVLDWSCFVHLHYVPKYVRARVDWYILWLMP